MVEEQKGHVTGVLRTADRAFTAAKASIGFAFAAYVTASVIPAWLMALITFVGTFYYVYRHYKD